MQCILLFLTLIATATAWDKPSFCKHKDCPRFNLLSRFNGYEIRTYKPSLWAVVSFPTSTDLEEDGMKAFALLRNYFRGNNSQKVALSPTVPIAHNFSMHGASGGAFSLSVYMYLPDTYQKNAPEPISKDISLVVLPEFTAYIRSFDGFPSQKRVLNEYRTLMGLLQEGGEDFDNSYGVFSMYNYPIELHNRHNEVMLPQHTG